MDPDKPPAFVKKIIAILENETGQKVIRIVDMGYSRKVMEKRANFFGEPVKYDDLVVRYFNIKVEFGTRTPNYEATVEIDPAELSSGLMKELDQLLGALQKITDAEGVPIIDIIPISENRGSVNTPAFEAKIKAFKEKTGHSIAWVGITITEIMNSEDVLMPPTVAKGLIEVSL